MQLDYLTALLGIQGYRVSHIEQLEEAPGRSVVRLKLERVSEGYTCGGCGKTVSGAQDHTIQELRHLMLWQHRTIVSFPRYRAICPDCGVITEAVEFADIRGPRVAGRDHGSRRR